MRNKELLGVKLEKVEREVKKIAYSIRRNENDVAYELVAPLLELLSDMQTLLNTETQD